MYFFHDAAGSLSGAAAAVFRRQRCGYRYARGRQDRSRARALDGEFSQHGCVAVRPLGQSYVYRLTATNPGYDTQRLFQHRPALRSDVETPEVRKGSKPEPDLSGPVASVARSGAENWRP